MCDLFNDDFIILDYIGLIDRMSNESRKMCCLLGLEALILPRLFTGKATEGSGCGTI